MSNLESKPFESGHAPVNGIDMYYQVPGRISGARLLILPGGHGDYLGEAVMTRKPSRYPELTARLIEEFLDSEP